MAATSLLEQYVLEMINAVRLDPAGWAARFGIDLNEGLPPGTISATPKQVLAMSDLLLATADFHNDWMIANDTFTTTGYEGSNPGDRMAFAGFNDAAAFEWGEVLRAQPVAAAATVHEETMVYNMFRQMFLDAGSRAILLNGNFNEIGIGFTNGILGGQPTMRAYALTNDLGASDELFITGGAFQPTILDVLSAPRPVTGIAVSSGDTATVTNEGGGYRIAVTTGEQELIFGDARVTLDMPDENVKIDLIGGSTIRSTHTITVHEGVGAAELLGISDVDLFAGNDAGSVRLEGNSGSNRLVGNWLSNQLDGGAGADRMEGGGGDDFYTIDNAGDIIVELVGAGFDRLTTSVSYVLGAGVSIEEMRIASVEVISDIHLTGNELAQDLLGNWGDNHLTGGGGDDQLFGSIGSDTLHGGLGRDVLYGGSDADRFVYLSGEESRPGVTRDVIADWEAGDLIDFSQLDGNTLQPGWQGLTFVGAGAATRIVDPGQVKYYQVNGNTYVVASVDGDDQADLQIEILGLHHLDASSFMGLATVSSGTDGDDIITGTAGDDIIQGGLGRDVLTGGGGADRFVYATTADSRIGEPRDIITDWAAGDRIDLSQLDARSDIAGPQGFTFVGYGAATRNAAPGELKYYQVNGKTYLVGSTNADNNGDFQLEIDGLHHFKTSDFIGLGNAVLAGTTVADTLTGTDGNDVLRGGLGADSLFGGAGGDRFVYRSAADSGVGPARDVIRDWSADDRLDLSLLDGDISTAPHDALDFIGAGPATRIVDEGAIKYYHVNGNTYVVASVDGDSNADFQIEIIGLHTLTASNFILE